MRLSTVSSRFGIASFTAIILSGLFSATASAAPLSGFETSDVSVGVVQGSALDSVPTLLSLAPFTAPVGKLGSQLAYAYDEVSRCFGVVLGGGSAISGAHVLKLLRGEKVKLRPFRGTYTVLGCEANGDPQMTILNSAGLIQAVRAKAGTPMRGADGTMIQAVFDQSGKRAKATLAREVRSGGATFSLVSAEIIAAALPGGHFELIIKDVEGGKLVAFSNVSGAYHTDLTPAVEAVLVDRIEPALIGAPKFILNQ